MVELLKAAFVEDRLTKEELDTRVGQALASRTYADLAAVTADIPAGLIAGKPGEPVRVRGRPPMSIAAKAGISVVVAAAAPAVLSLVIGPLAFAMFAPFYFMALLVAGAQILFTRYDKRSCGQLPPGPGQGGKAAEGQRPGRVAAAGPAGHDPALPGARPDPTRTDLRTFSSWPGSSHSCGRGALVLAGPT
jgi:hypothetical protein